MSFCEKIVNLRKKFGLTQREVAARLHVDRSTYAYYELGRTAPSFRLLLALARFYDVTVESLIDNDTNIRWL